MRRQHVLTGLLLIGGLVVSAWLALGMFVPVCGCEEPPPLEMPMNPAAANVPGFLPAPVENSGPGAAALVPQSADDDTSLDEFLWGVFGDLGDSSDGLGLQDLLDGSDDETRLVEGEPLDPSEIYERLAPAVAFLEIEDGTGSGILIDPRHVVTNVHVVWPSGQARVRFVDGTEFVDAPVVGWDLMADLAIIELPVSVPIVPATLASDGVPAIGSNVYFVGYPMEDEYAPVPAITRGLVSRERDWVTADVAYVQTDATIVGGQSGGALVDERGEVVGVAAFSLGDGSGAQFGYAIAIDELRERTVSLIAGGDTDGLGDRFDRLVDPDDGRIIGPGEIAPAALDHAGDVDTFEIDLEAGQTVLIGVSSSHFKADVTIEDEQGGSFTDGEPTGLILAGPNASVEFTATESGRHVITVSDMWDEAGGVGYYLMVR